jgi:predicted nucleic acid-binding protein
MARLSCSAQENIRRSDPSQRRARRQRALLSTYPDSSFLVSLYVSDAHSTEAERRLLDGPRLILTPFHLAEWAHAIGQHRFRGVLSAEGAARLNAQFAADRVSGLWREAAFPERAFELCAELARRHASQIGMRTLDTLHVACALELGADRFWTFDERQTKLAKAQGLKTH